MTTHRPTLVLEICAAALWVASASSAQLSTGSAAHGAQVYEEKCGGCHSLDANRIGPMHRGVYGRRSGTVPGFNYTPALRKLGVVWNANTLDRWLRNPAAMAPGTSMGIQVPSEQDRADVIAYLKQESGPPSREDGRP